MRRRFYKPGTLRRRQDGRYWFDIRIGGKRFIRILGTDKALAQRVLDKLRHEKGEEAVADKNGVTLLAKKAPGTFGAVADFFFANSRLGKPSERNLENYLDHLKAYFGEKDFLKITPFDVNEYKRLRLSEKYGDEEDRPYSKATINRELTCLKRILSWTETTAKGAIPMTLREIKLFPKAESEIPRERILSDKEQALLLEKAAAHIRPIIQMALWTGMRLGEILKLEWTDIRCAGETPKEIVVRGENAKSHRMRKIPVIAALAQVLGALPHSAKNVFINTETGKAWVSIKNSFGSARIAAGIEDVRFHDLRHTYATMCIENGVDLVTLQHWLGHSSILMTARYVKHGSGPMRERLEHIADHLEDKLERKSSVAVRPTRVSYNNSVSCA